MKVDFETIGTNRSVWLFDPLKKMIDEMHLTPFYGTVQLRPSFKYLDKIDEKHKQATKKVSDEENKEIIAKQKAESEQKAKALQVRINRAQEKRYIYFFSLTFQCGPIDTNCLDDKML